jgi:hypothetical protein
MTDADREHMRQLTEAINEALTVIAQLRADLAAIKTAQEHATVVTELHGRQLDAMTAALERFSAVLEKVGGTEH